MNRRTFLAVVSTTGLGALSHSRQSSPFVGKRSPGGGSAQEFWACNWKKNVYVGIDWGEGCDR
jgi:hypothetical protein